MSLPFYVTPEKRNRPWIFDPWPLGHVFSFSGNPDEKIRRTLEQKPGDVNREFGAGDYTTRGATMYTTGEARGFLINL
jgi:hypothetical protein